MSPSSTLSRVIRYIARALVGRGPVHHRHQVASGQRMNLGERLGERVGRDIDIDPAAPNSVGTRSTCDVGAATIRACVALSPMRAMTNGTLVASS